MKNIKSRDLKPDDDGRILPQRNVHYHRKVETSGQCENNACVVEAFKWEPNFDSWE